MAIAGYTDLFAAGLGFDITGACLLARGLLTKPDEVAKRTVASRNTFSAATVRTAEDFADGKAGVTALVVGFVVQAVGYVLSIGGVHSHAHGTSAAIIAIACTAVAIALAYVLARLARWHWTRDWLVEQARWDQLGVRHDDPHGRELMGYALVLRKVAPEESYDDDLLRQARRVWGIDRVREMPTGDNY